MLLKRVWQYLFFDASPTKSKISPTHQMLIFSLVVGFAYGALVSPIWNEMVEWGQSMAGMILPNPQNVYRMTQPTLQTLIPAVLFKAGLGERFLACLTSGVTCALSFAAWSLASYIFVKRPGFCILIPFMFLNYPYANFHFYPVVFPYDFFIFGQVGMYLAALGIFLLALGRQKTPMVIAGILPAIHPPWAIGNLVAIASFSLIKGKVPGGRNGLVLFLVSLTTSIGLYFGLKTFIPYEPLGNIYKEKPGNAIDVFDISIMKEQLTEKETQPLSFERPEGSEIAHPPSSHNARVQDQVKLWQSLKSFYQYDFWLLALFWLLFFTHKDFFRERISHLFILFLSLTSFALFFKVVEIWDAGYGLFSIIDDRLPGLITRAVVNRFFNLSLIILPIALYSLLGYFALERGRLLAALAIPFTLWFHGEPMFWGDHATPLFIFIFMVLVLLCLPPSSFKRIKINFEFKKNHIWGMKSLRCTIALILVVIFFLFLKKTIIDKNFLFSHSYTDIVEPLKEGDKNVLAGYNITSFPGLNVPLMTRRPLYFPDGIELSLFDNENSILNIYCHLNAYDSAQTTYENTQSCFKERSLYVWQYIAAFLNADYVLVTEDFETQLPLVAKSGRLKLYKIPSLNERPTDERN